MWGPIVHTSVALFSFLCDTLSCNSIGHPCHSISILLRSTSHVTPISPCIFSILLRSTPHVTPISPCISCRWVHGGEAAQKGVVRPSDHHPTQKPNQVNVTPAGWVKSSEGYFSRKSSHDLRAKLGAELYERVWAASRSFLANSLQEQCHTSMSSCAPRYVMDVAWGPTCVYQYIIFIVCAVLIMSSTVGDSTRDDQALDLT